MPSGSPRPKTGVPGTDIELVFVDPLPHNYECPVCQQALRYPVQFDQCSHHVCSSCLPQLIKEKGSKCPVDGKSFDRDQVYVDKNLQKTIQQLKVKCTFHENGCQWIGQLKEVPSHIPECVNADIVCPRGCGVIYQRKDQEKHTVEECQKRTVICEHCEKEIKKNHLDDHYKACPLFPMPCPNQCDKKSSYPREQLPNHLIVCPKAGNACPFAEFGCQHKGEKQTLQKHIREEPTRHLSILCDGVVELKVMLLNMQLGMESLGRRMDELAVKTDALEKLFGAQLLWKIDNYQQKFNEAKAGSRTTIFSPAFVTGRHGYKMCVSACLYGDGKVRGKYMSVFVGLLRGDYDVLLSWPFSHRVTFTLLDQCQDPAGRHNITYTVKPNTTKENRPFLGRPTSERNASFGAQKFCELTLLEQLDYVRDDIVFIKVTVDTEDMTPL